MSYGIQLIALIIILIVVIEFFRYKRLNLLTTRMYEILVLLSILSVFFEGLCLFTCYHPEYFSFYMTRTIHQFFFVNLNLTTWMIYMYIDLRTRAVKTYSYFQFFWRTIPLLFSVVLAVFGEISYYKGDDGAYAYGTIPLSSYIVFWSYFFLIILLMFRSEVHKEKLFQFEFCVFLTIWASLVIVQFMFPFLVLSSASVCVAVFFFYLIFENSKDYSDKEVYSAFSRHSFEYTVQELLKLGKRFWVINFSMQNVESIRSTYGQKVCMECLEKTIQIIPEFKSHSIFRTLYYSFCFIIYSEEELKNFYNRYKLSERNLLLSDYMVAPSFSVCSVECPTIVSSSDDLIDLLSFCRTEFDSYTDSSIQIIDLETARKREHRVAIEKLLQKAIDEDGFDVFFQPIVNAITKKCVSFEALVRLKDKETLGYISPEIFIPIAEKKGLVSQVGDKVVNKVCSFIRKYNLDKQNFWGVGINLSGMQMLDPSLPYRLNQAVKNYDIPPKFVNFEVTETVAVNSGKVAKSNIEKLKKLGYRFSMDDFGTGYSNFSSMASINYDLVKIDKSMIWDAFKGNNQKSMTVLLSIVNMIHSIGCSIVAEGVDEEKLADFLKECGIEFLQGFFFSKPLSQEDFIEYLTENSDVAIEDSKKSFNSLK